jgi:hypothetical protein
VRVHDDLGGGRRAGRLDHNQLLAARRLTVDAATAELARRLREADVRWLLLKGPVVARRLYGDGTPRHYEDVDVLPAHDCYEAAETVIQRLGYAPADRLPRIQVEHADTWQRPHDRPSVDLHRSLPHLGADPGEVWNALARDTEEMVVAGERVEVCGMPGFALLMVLHALHHAPFGGRPLGDLERAVAQIPASEWGRAAALAKELGAEMNFAAGLALTATAASLARDLALPAIPRWEARLRTSDVWRLSSPLKLIAEAHGLRGKLAVLRHEVFPPKRDRPFFEDHYSSGSPSVIFIRRLGRLVGKAPLAVAVWYLERKDRRRR